MEITTSQQQGRVPVTVFHIKGEIDAQTYEQLESQVQGAIQAGTHYVVLDLSQVDYISSYGIRGISQIFSWLRDDVHGEDDESLSRGLRDGKFKSSHLKLAAPSKQVERLLSMSGLDMFLDIQPDLKQAIASF